jgi:hypothetical protein
MNFKNFTIQNCFLGGHSFGGWLSNSLTGNLIQSLVSNCLIQNQINGGEQNTFRNNFFLMQIDFVTSGLPPNSMYENNVFWGSFSSNNSTIVNNVGWLNGSNNIQGGIISENFTELFINPGPNSNGRYYFDPKNNYRIKSTSKGKNGGTDGTDIGIYGGAFPWDDSGQYDTPVIYHKKVGPKSTSDGKLKVEYKVRSGN